MYLDGYDQTALLKGEGPGKRSTLFYFDDNAQLNAMRWNDWKIHFAFQMEGWAGPREALNFPRMVNLRSDPYETSIDSGLYTRFFADQLWLFVPVQQEVGKWLMTFRQFPPRQPTASFTVDGMMQQMQQMLQMRAMGADAAPAQAQGVSRGLTPQPVPGVTAPGLLSCRTPLRPPAPRRRTGPRPCGLLPRHWPWQLPHRRWRVHRPVK